MAHRPRWTVRQRSAIGLLALGIGLSLTVSQGASAVAAAGLGDTFTQRILPLDCIFETVNDGTGILYYLTPAQCGVAVTVAGGTQSGTTSDASLISLGNNRPVSFSSSATSTSGGGAISFNQWGRLATAAPVSNQPTVTESSPPANVAVVAGGVTAALAIIILLAFVL